MLKKIANKTKPCENSYFISDSNNNFARFTVESLLGKSSVFSSTKLSTKSSSRTLAKRRVVGYPGLQSVKSRSFDSFEK